MAHAPCTAAFCNDSVAMKSNPRALSKNWCPAPLLSCLDSSRNQLYCCHLQSIPDISRSQDDRQIRSCHLWAQTPTREIRLTQQKEPTACPRPEDFSRHMSSKSLSPTSRPRFPPPAMFALFKQSKEGSSVGLCTGCSCCVFPQPASFPNESCFDHSI